MNRLKTIYTVWSKLRPFTFILVATCLTLILTIPFAVGLDLLEVKEESIGKPKFEELGIIASFFGAVIFAPIVETLFGQVIPFYLAQKFIQRNTSIVAIILSTLTFSFSHVGYSYYYVLLIIPMGLILALTYFIFQKRRESSFWMTCFVHSIRNLIAVCSYFYF
jgi:membrane protease YdiL (CAAX protease family)